MTELDLEEKLAFEFPAAQEMRDKHHEFQMKMAVIAKKFAYEYLGNFLDDFKYMLELQGYAVLAISTSQFKVLPEGVPEAYREVFTMRIVEQIEAFLESRKYTVNRKVFNDPNLFDSGFVYELKVMM